MMTGASPRKRSKKIVYCTVEVGVCPFPEGRFLSLIHPLVHKPLGGAGGIRLCRGIGIAKDANVDHDITVLAYCTGDVSQATYIFI